MKRFFLVNIFLLFLLLKAEQSQAQKYDCSFKAPFINIDFGSGDIPDVNSYLSKYEREFNNCPRDGFYSFSSRTSNCFNGDWFTINQDHTGNTPNGNMMLVNASETGGVFFNTRMSGFNSNTTYQLSLYMMNVCKINGGCAPLPPNILISILTPDGKKLVTFRSGLLTQGNVPRWKRYLGFFKTPPGVISLNLIMADETLGGCGNDFVLDDITISECAVIVPEVKKEPVPIIQKPVKQQSPVVKESVVKKSPAATNTLPKISRVKKDTTVITTTPINNKPLITTPTIGNRAAIKLPESILTRANPIVKHITTDAGHILIELYDNGEIDGDIVSIYHNNQMIVSQANLSQRPVSFQIKADKLHPHHEIVMVANNLGSIPPNTSMMIITANNKRHEVFISSSEQKNAKVVIDLNE
jgi:hypothetical protein